MRVYRNDRLRALGIELSAPRPGDAGYDLVAIAPYRVAAGQRLAIDTGLHLEIPAGYVGLIKDRSSLAAAGLHTIAGVIDSAYRGEVKILLVNQSQAEMRVSVGQKIAQLVIVPIYAEPVAFVESLDELSSSARGEAGFGSTGE